MSQLLTLIPREEVLEPKRVMSVFRERVEKHKEEIAELEEREKLVEKEKPVSTQDICGYLHQFLLHSGTWLSYICVRVCMHLSDYFVEYVVIL
jgi:hypothetical protein